MHSKKNDASNKTPVNKHPACTSEVIKVKELIFERDNFWHNDLEPPRGKLSGNKRLRNPLLNKLLHFSHRERQLLGIHGRLPIAHRSEDEQIKFLSSQILNLKTNFQKYVTLFHLYTTKREIFFRILQTNDAAFMPLLNSDIPNSFVTTFNLLTGSSLGISMFINIKDKGHVYDVLSNWPLRCVRCIQVSDGSNITNIGDWGINVMSVLISNLQQNVVFGGIHPDYCLCVALDLGTNNPDCLTNNLYMGLREKRSSWPEYVEFFEEFLQAVFRLFGTRTIIQCKDFTKKSALHHVTTYGSQYCIVDIDYHCLTASGLAGLIVANRIAKRSYLDNVIIFYGNSIFNIGMARLYISFMMMKGSNFEDAKKSIWFYDRYGLIVENRTKYKVPIELLDFAQKHAQIQTLEEAIDDIKPNVLIGDSCQTNAFTSEVLNAMERNTEWPIIFVMSKSILYAECTAEDAFVRTKGRCIFISSGQLPPFKYANKLYQPSWCRSTYLTGGIMMGAMLAGVRHVPNEIYCIAAEQLSHLVWPNDYAQRNVYPPPSKMIQINLQISKAVLSHALQRRWATLWPEPENPTDYIISKTYNTKYREPFDKVYSVTDYKIGTSESQYYYKLNI